MPSINHPLRKPSPESVAAGNLTAFMRLVHSRYCIGAAWTSCSPDFEPQGVIDRFGQVEAKFFIARDGYFGSGKIVELAVRNIVHGVPVRNRAALANAEAPRFFANIPELAV